MASRVGNISLPVDQSGSVKQVGQGVQFELNYNAGTIDFKEGDVISFSTQNWTGTVLDVNGNTNTGIVKVIIDEPVPAVPVNTLGEDMLVNAIKFAEIANLDNSPIYFQRIQLVGKESSHVVEADHLGSLFVRYDEGAPHFDAYNKMQTSEETIIGEYLSQYEVDVQHWFIDTASGGSITHVNPGQGHLISTDTTNGSKAEQTTHLYHHNQVGLSQTMELGISLGSSGQTNLERYWGYGDEDDGLFFSLIGTTLQVLQRSSTQADVVVSQADWNIDRLDGSFGLLNPSEFTIDVTKLNTYWIDIQVATGRVRFGIFVGGARQVVHEILNDNTNIVPFIHTASLPIHIEQINTGITGDSSSMRFWHGVVKTGGKFEPTVREYFKHTRTNERVGGGVYQKAIGNWHPGRPLFTIRPKLSNNGITNRIVSIPTYLSVSNVGSSSMWIAARRNATLLDNPTFEDFHPESSLEFTDQGGINKSNRGVQVGMWVIPPDSTVNLDLSSVFGYRKERLLLNGDGLTQETFQYTFTSWNMALIAGGADQGDYIVDIASNTITKTSGPAFTDVNQDGVAFMVGHILRLHDADGSGDTGDYMIIGVTGTVLTVEHINGDTVTFTGSTTDTVKLQAGDRSIFFGHLNVEDII